MKLLRLKANLEEFWYKLTGDKQFSGILVKRQEMHERHQNVEHFGACREAALGQARDDSTKQAILHKGLNLRRQIVEDLRDQLYRRKYKRRHGLLDLILALLVLLDRQRLVDFEDVHEDVILDYGRLQNLPTVRDEVLVVAHEVRIIPFDTEAEQPQQLLDQKLPLRQRLILAQIVIVFGP